MSRSKLVIVMLLVSLPTVAWGGKLQALRGKSAGSPKPAARSAPARASNDDRNEREEREERDRQRAAEQREQQYEQQREQQAAAQREAAATTRSTTSSSIRNATRTARSSDQRRKLGSIRAATNQHASRDRRPRDPAPVPVRSDRHQPYHHRHRPLRHPRWQYGFGFDYHSPRPVTVVEEHHYYDNGFSIPPNSVVPCDPVVIHDGTESYAPIEELTTPGEPFILPQPIVTPVMPAESSIVTECDEQQVVISDFASTLKPIHFRLELDHANDEADVDRTGFGMLLNATGGLGVDLGVRLFRERDADFRDHMWMGDANIVYEIMPSDFARTRVGIGINWLADSYGGESGLNLTLGTDLFAGPVVFSGEVDLGTLGDADLFHGRLTAALRQGEHIEWFAGYDYLDIGGVEIRGVVGGVRFRF